MAMHEELGRLDIQLLGDVFARFYPFTTAFRAMAGFRLVAMFNTWQMFWQWLTTGTSTLRSWLRHQGVDFHFNGCAVGIGSFLKKIALLG